MTPNRKRLLFWSPRMLCIVFAAFISLFALDVLRGRLRLLADGARLGDAPEVDSHRRDRAGTRLALGMDRHRGLHGDGGCVLFLCIESESPRVGSAHLRPLAANRRIVPGEPVEAG